MQDFDGQVVQVACGQDHSLFLMDKGEVYSCGRVTSVQTGLGHYITSMPTSWAETLPEWTSSRWIPMGTATWSCWPVGASSGRGALSIFSWPLSPTPDRWTSPQCLPFSGVAWVKQAVCGGTGCAVLNREGHVFVWGYGILGKGPNLLETTLSEMIPSTLFGLMEFNPGVQVSRIRCKLSHFAALTNRRELIVWGKNIQGCLGGRPVLPTEGDYSWGARGCAVWCGSHGDSGQVPHLNLLLDPLKPGPGLRTTWPAQQGWPRGSEWGPRVSGSSMQPGAGRPEVLELVPVPPAQGEACCADAAIIRQTQGWVALAGRGWSAYVGSFQGIHGGFWCHVWSLEILFTQPSLCTAGIQWTALHGGPSWKCQWAPAWDPVDPQQSHAL